MLFNFDDQEVKQVTFNGNAVNFINLNGTQVWANIPDVPIPSHSAVTTSSVVISWTAVDRANDYTILLGGSTYPTTNTQITINNLSHNTSFNYQVKANGDGGSSEYSAVKSFKTSQEALATPSVSTSQSTSSVTLSWSAIPNATQYSITFGGATSTQSGTSKTFSGLTQNTGFDWQVRAEDTSGSGSSKYADSSYDTGNAKTSQETLATPSPSATSTTTSITVTWSQITNADGYVVKLGGTNYAVSGGATVSKTITNLIPNTSYSYQVQATDSAGSGSGRYVNSSFSSSKNVSTQKIAGQVIVQINTPKPINISAGFNMLTVPEYVDVVSAVCIGAGGGAGGSGNNLGYGSGLSSGGGGGGALSYGEFSITNSSDRYFITKVGSAGLGTYSNGEDGGRTFIYLVNNIGTTVYRTNAPSYDIYVDLYEDLIAYYNNNIAGSGTSKWSWGKSHWESNGKSEGRWLTGEVFLSSYGGLGGKLASPSLSTYQSNTQGYGGVSISTAYRIAGYSGGTGGLASRNYSGGGGGGAAGYAGIGGSGRYGNSNIQYSGNPTIPSANSGAAAGGYTASSYCYGGGGVNLYGNSSTATYQSNGGSGGSSGLSSGLGGSYGGGGGSDDDDTERAGGNGGVGGIRLVWGDSSRYYPNSNPNV